MAINLLDYLMGRLLHFAAVAMVMSVLSAAKLAISRPWYLLEGVAVWLAVDAVSRELFCLQIPC